MTTSHTPGPWTAVNWDIVATDRTVSRTICEIAWAPKNRMEEAAANARLIAAAPDLLNLLEGIVSDFEPYIEDEPDDDIRERNEAWVTAARALIAKAEGRS